MTAEIGIPSDLGVGVASPAQPLLRRLPIAVLISGQGTNLEAILSACESGRVAADVRVVASNRPARGLEFSQRRGIPTEVFTRNDYQGDRNAQQKALVQCLEEHGVELVVLAGFDQILSDELVQRFSYRIINVHPSLLPAFGGGMHAIRDALNYGVKVTGCTIHFVAADFPEADSGPVILQDVVPVLDDDDEASLLSRIHEVEHRLLPAAIQLIAEGRVRVDGRHITILARATALPRS